MISDAAKEAARLLRVYADELGRHFRTDGRWDGGQRDIEAVYRHLLEVAVALEADRHLPPALCGHQLARLPDGSYQCLRCDRVGDWQDGAIRWREEARGV